MLLSYDTYDCIRGKTSVADNFVLKDDWSRYYTFSEVGYLEIGNNIKVYMSPGETFGELLVGGDGTNPDNYVLAGLQYNKRTDVFDSDTWCLISYGKSAAPTFISKFYEIYDSVR